MSETRELNRVQALNEALDLYLEREEGAVVLGEDVGHFGGVFRVTAGLQEKYGAERVFDTPLAEAGIERVETDLAEHIIQLADEPPSHIVVPAMHKTREEVAELFTAHHADPHEQDDVAELVESARRELRPKYVSADIGISGANFLIADTGSRLKGPAAEFLMPGVAPPTAR